VKVEEVELFFVSLNLSKWFLVSGLIFGQKHK
jgi:hypothetical protein